MTDSEIAKLQSRVDDRNRESRLSALAAYQNGPIPKMKWTMEHILKHLIDNLALVKAGKCSGRFIGDSFTLDELARVLTTPAYVWYDVLFVIKEKVASAPANAPLEEVTYITGLGDSTPEYVLWRKIVVALVEYLYACAVLAKAANPYSSTATLFLRAWKIARAIEQDSVQYNYATKKEALTIVRLATVATQRLWLDIEFARLPPFKTEPMAEPKETKPANPKAGKPKSGKAKGKKAN